MSVLAFAGPLTRAEQRKLGGRGLAIEPNHADRPEHSTFGSPGVGKPPDGDWLIATLTSCSDVVAVIDRLGTISWINGAARTLVGWDPELVIGQSIADYLHPDDVGRAIEVVSLQADGAFDSVPITQALYRIRLPAGSWTTLEINAAQSATDDDALVLIGRNGGDLVLTDQLLEAVTNGDRFDRQVELVMELGRWRHPNEGYAIFYTDLDRGIRVSNSNDLPALLAGDPGADGPTPWGSALGRGTDVTIRDLATVAPDDDRIGPELASAALAAGFTGCLAAPVPDPADPTGSCIVIWTRAEGPTLAGHGYAVSNMRRALALVLQQRAQVTALERLARTDDLTGLMSRRRFFEILTATDAPHLAGSNPVVLYVDLDGFKSVNDRFGHADGDRVLRVAAQRLATLAPPGATLARLGGDEFVLLLASGATEEQAGGLAQAIVENASLPIPLDHHSVTLGASVGVAVGKNGQMAKQVLDAADRALLDAKDEGRGRWTLAP